MNKLKKNITRQLKSETGVEYTVLHNIAKMSKSDLIVFLHYRDQFIETVLYPNVVVYYYKPEFSYTVEPTAYYYKPERK